MKPNLNKKNDKPEFLLMEQSEKLNDTLNDLLKHECHYVLLGNYPNLPHSFSGNDIDIIVTDIKIAEKVFRKNGFIIRKQYKNELRVFLYVESIKKWVAVDVENINNYPKNGKRILEFILKNPVKSKKNQLLHPPNIGILSYKIMKYIFNGYVHSWYQIQNLYKEWNTLKENEKEVVLGLLKGFNLNNKTKHLLNLVLSSESKIRPNDQLLMHINNIRKTRHEKRLIYQGKINLTTLLKEFSLLLRLINGRFVKSKNALPAIALVGNDGSGKTEQCQRLKDELYKLDPLHIIMRGNETWLPGWGLLRNIILGYIKNRKSLESKLTRIITWCFAWIGEIGDFLDKWFRYQIGMAWANAGFGFVIFERYPTDRLRGEYPGPKWSLFPIEQYFPMPDIIALLDVNEDDSLKRKPNDGHSYQEMHEKRENYLRLIKEIKPSIVISSKKSLDDIQRQLSKLIWDCSLVKQRGAQIYSKFPAKWSPKIDDKMPKRGKQKDGFL